MTSRSQRHKSEVLGYTSQDYNAHVAPTDITLSASTIVHSAAIGTVVGTLAAVDADYVDSWVFSFTSNPSSLFKIVGNSLQANVNNLTAGTKAITILATDFYGKTFSKAFSITVT